MTLTISATGDPNRLDIYEEDSKIGEIVCELPDPDDPADSDPPYWSAEIWSLMGTGKVWTADSKSPDEIKEYAHELYAEFVNDQRSHGRAEASPLAATRVRRSRTSDSRGRYLSLWPISGASCSHGLPFHPRAAPYRALPRAAAAAGPAALPAPHGRLAACHAGDGGTEERVATAGGRKWQPPRAAP